MFERVLHYLGVCFRFVPAWVSVGLVGVFCLGTAGLLLFLGFRKGLRWTAFLLLVEYMVLLLILSLGAREVSAERMFDFAPFWSWRAIRAGDRALVMPCVMNVVAFVPIGLLVGCVFGRVRWWKVLVCGAGFSLLIETVQFLTRRGFAEFDDLFHNVLGCLIGYGVWRAVAKVLKINSKR